MNYVLTVAEGVGLNMILALSVYATLMVGRFSLAQVGFWSIGAYVVGMLTSCFGLPLVPSLLVGGLFCAAIGVILGYPCLRIRGIYLTLATVAFSEIVRVFFDNVTYQVEINNMMVGPAGALGFRNIRVLTSWPTIFGAVALTCGLFAWIERSRLGLSTNAIREDETAAACAGIDPVAIKLSMFALGAFIAGVGGGLYGTYTSYVTADDFGFDLALTSIFYVAIAGTERFYGAVFGALVLTVLPSLLQFFGDLKMIAYGVIVLVIMTIFPRGMIDALRGRCARSARTRKKVQRPVPSVRADRGMTGASNTTEWE